MFTWVLVVVGVLVALWGLWHVVASIRDSGMPETKWRRFLVRNGPKAARVYACASGIFLLAFGLFLVLLGFFGHEGSPTRP